VRQKKGKEIGEGGGALAHRRHRNRARKLAGLQVFGDKFCRVESTISRGSKGRRERRARLFIDGGLLAEEARVRSGSEIGRCRRKTCSCRTSGWRWKMTCGPGSSAGKEEAGIPLRENEILGRGTN
jgi:hypothetical protein